MITISGVDPQMIANNLEPFEPTHPGAILKEEIEFRKLSKRKLAEQIGVSYFVLNGILNAKRPLTTEIALLLEAALGVSSSLFLRMQADYDAQTAKRSQSLLARLEKLRKIAAVL